MERMKSKRRIVSLFAAIATACLGAGALMSALAPSSTAQAAVGDRVNMVDLLGRYPIDYVLGPIDVVDVNGRDADGKLTGEPDGKIDRDDLKADGTFTYKSTNFVKDTDGNPILDSKGNKILTNNIYGIPAEKYFDVESYIYTEGKKDSAEGRTLYGWKPNIRAVLSTISTTGQLNRTQTKLAENGEILTTGGKLYENKEDTSTGIFVTYTHATATKLNEYGTTEKYALIVPSDITVVGQGSAAFVADAEDGTPTTYYNNTTVTSGTNVAAFTDFSCFTMIGLQPDVAPYFWQPRERLAGVFFPEDSRLQTVTGSKNDTVGTATLGRSTTASIGKAAFQDCNNLRFMVLPGANSSKGTTGVTTIGNYAFYRCSKIADTNIPTSVTSIGKLAYAGTTDGTELLHISIPDTAALKKAGAIGADVFQNCTKLKSVDNGANYSSSFFPAQNSTLYVMGNRPENGVSDAGAFLFERTSAGVMHAVSIAGETGEDPNKVFAFPSGEDFNDNSDNVRRNGVQYDYLGCNAQKSRNSLAGVTVTEYDIAPSFAESTWCQNVILPKEVKTIGARAFYDSHVKYLETYAITIGENAFNEKTSSTITVPQWFYLHKAKNASGGYTITDYDVATNAFATQAVTRNIVYEDYALYKKFSDEKTAKVPDWLNKGTVKVHYQIPIVANINNQDNETYAFKEGDLAEYFFNDSDYVKNPQIKSGNNTIVYTKKLNTVTFSYTKQATGGWLEDTDSAKKQANPVLSHMDSTVWFNGETYGTALAETTNTALGGAATLFKVNETGAVNIYTKIVARPENIKNGTYDGTYQGDYTFGETYTFGAYNKTLGDDDTNEEQRIGFYSVLGLSSADYSIDLNRFVYADGRTPGTATHVQHAGTYTFDIRLNPKWGVWSSDYINDVKNAGYFTATATVARKQLDYTSLDKLPKFANSNGEWVLHGAETPIYRYNDGWYVAQKSGEEYIETRTVTNSFAYYTGSDIKIKLVGERVIIDDNGLESTATLGDVQITSRNGLAFAPSSEYMASYEFRVKMIPNTTQSDYIFNYGGDSDTKYNNLSDANAGLSMTAKQDFSFRITKRWFIVMQTNMFVVSGNTPYAPVANSDLHYTDDITAQVPALNFGDDVGTIDFEIAYTPVGGRAVTIRTRTTLDKTGENAANTIGYYINSSMPAGAYTLKLYGSEVTVQETSGGVTSDKTYPEISGEYHITVLPKALDAQAVAALHAQMQKRAVEENGVSRTTNEYPLIGSGKMLHEPIAAQEAALNGKLNLFAPSAGADNYWTADYNSENPQYFDKKVTIGYNLEGSGNYNYYSYANMLGQLTSASEYTLYYSITAKNYVTVGGADADDRQERGFKTTLYTDVKVSEFYEQLLNPLSPFFQNVVYTGGTAHTVVPASQYYSYDFTDKDYVNARSKATVTLTLYDADLARWNTLLPTSGTGRVFTQDEVDDAPNHYVLSEDGKSLIVFFDILPAENKWEVTPQMPAWSFNGFDASVNFITAGLKFTGASYRFALIPVAVTNPQSIAFNSSVVKDANGIVYFTVNASGRVEGTNAAATAEMIKQLNALKPGDYYLKSFVDGLANAGTEADYAATYATYNAAGFAFIAHTGTEQNPVYISMNISPAANDWSVTPSVMRWTWGNYNKERNTISATSVYPALLPNGFTSFNYGTLPTITYYIVNEAGTNLTGNFTSTNGVVSDTVANILKDLPVGTYTLYTSLAKTDYFNAIAPSAHIFEVLPANNSWKVQPALAGWNYKAFVERNFRAGEPTFGNQADVVYKIFEGDKTAANADITSPLVTFNALTDNVTVNGVKMTVSEYLTQLGVLAGNEDYTLIASLTGGANYGNLEQRITFRVTKLNNTWETQPRLTSFPYQGFNQNTNFVGGVPQYPETGKMVTYGVIKLTTNTPVKPEDLTAFNSYNGLLFATFTTLNDSVIAELNKLGFGGYYFLAYAEGATNYSDLFAYVEFSVTGASNTWNENGIPAITGWTYNNYQGSFTAGSSLFGTVLYSVQKADADGNPIEGSFAITDKTADEFKPLLNGLGYGRYILIASVTATDDYDTVSHTVRFSVSKAENAWENNAPPTISGWTFGSTANTPSQAAPAFGDNAGDTDAVEYKYYKARQDQVSGSWVASDEAVANIATAGYGVYAMVATVAHDDNHEALSHTVIFTIAQYQGTWEIAPEYSLSWNWGVSAEWLQNTNLYKACVDEPEDAVIKYTVDGKTYTKTQLVDALRKLSVGTYDITVFVEVDATSSYTYENRLMQVTVNEATFNVTQEPSSNGWTWGAASKVFNELKLAKVWKVNADAEGDALVSVDAEVKYYINVSGGWTEEQTYAEMIADLSGRDAGTYTVRMTVSFDNYETITKNVTVVIDKAEFAWNTNHAPTTAKWKWDDTDNSKKIVVEPKAHGVNNVEAVLGFTLNNTSYTYGDLLDYLYGADKGTYEITVSLLAGEGYDTNNYKPFSGSFTVTVEQATNVWTANAPQDGKQYNKEYGTPLDEILEAQAKFGTGVEYTNAQGNQLTNTYTNEAGQTVTVTVTDIATLNEWINSLASSDTRYEFRIIVKSDAKQNFTALSVTNYVKVSGIGSTWANQSKLDDQGLSKTFTYTDGIQINDTNFVIPEGRPDSTTGGTTKYTVAYKDYKGEHALSSDALSTVSQVYAWILFAEGKVGIAGTYDITAVFTPSNPNYATLNETVTLTILRATVAWAEKLERYEYTGNYGSIEVPTPSISVAGCNVTILLTVMDNDGDPVANPQNLPLAEFVKTLDAGRYTVTYSVENSYNYNGLNEESSNLFISAVPNAWKTVGGITTANWTNGYTWTYMRGSLGAIAVTFPEAVIGDVAVTFDGTPLDLSRFTGDTLTEKLNDYLKGENFNGKTLAAGRHTLVFTVEGTDNYNGLTSNCAVVVNKIANSWKTGKVPADYVGSGSVKESDLIIPEATVSAIGGQELILFDVVKVGGTYRQTSLTQDLFVKELDNLSNGTFTVTVRVGGAIPSDLTQAMQSAWEKYNEDYEALSGSFSITLTPNENSFTTKIAGSGWTAGDTVGSTTITMPVASYGNDKIVYTVSGSDDKGIVSKEIRADKYNTNAAQEAFDELITYLNTLNAGTYNITASIAPTDTYAAPSDTSVLVTVSKVTTAWNLTETQLNGYLSLTHAWSNNPSTDYRNLLPVLTLSNWSAGKIEFEYSDGSRTYPLTDDEETPDVNEGTWAYVLNHMNLPVGAYTFTARVKGDENHTDLSFRATLNLTPVTIEWSNADDINRRVVWTWGASDNEALTMPTLSGWAQSNVVYTLTDANGSTQHYSGSVWGELLAALVPAVRSAGSYLITAKVADATGNHTPSPLTLEIALTIDPVITAWTNDTPADNSRTEWTYIATNAYTNLPVQPIVDNWNGATVNYTLVQDGETGTLYSGSNWTALIGVLKPKTAGTYIITSSVTGDTNHTSLTHTQTVVISNETNFWKAGTTGSNTTVETIVWTYKAEVGSDEGKNESIVFEPQYNKENLIITLNGRNITSEISAAPYNGDLNRYLSETLGATPEGNSHTIVASVAADGRYTGITRTINLKINRANNSWRQELAIASRADDGKSWAWDNLTVNPGDSEANLNFVFTAPVPEQGSSVLITVKTKTGGVEMFTFSLTITNHLPNTNDLYALYNRLLGLDVNEYVITARVEYSDNYDALTNNDVVTFSVTKAANRWETPPEISGWSYDGDTAYPSSRAKYGAETVQYTYAAVLDGEGETPNTGRTWVANLPMAAGSYWLKAYVPATGEYGELVGYKKFSIGQGQNSWVNMPGVIPWSWNGYDKDVNLFSGSARSDGTVKFTIYRGLTGEVNSVPNHEALKLSDFLAYNDFKAEADKFTVTAAMLEKLQNFTLASKIVSADVAQLLNALRPGSYVIYATAASGNSLGDIEGWQRFTITNARNEWTTKEGGDGQAVTPNVISFEHGKFDAEQHFTAGIVKYGSSNVLYRITGADYDDNTVIRAENGVNAASITAEIASLPAGRYSLQVWVLGASGATVVSNEYTYEAYYTKNAPFSVTFNVTREANDWEEGKKPVSSISITYRTLSGLESFGTYFPEPAVISGDDVEYAILNSNQTPRVSGLTYAELLQALKNIEDGKDKIGYGSFIIRSSVDEVCSYSEISADTAIEITRLANAFNGLPSGNEITGDWLADGQTTFTNFNEITATEGEVIYVYGRDEYGYDGIVAFLKTQNAGLYNVDIYVTGTNEYEGLTNTTLRINIRQANNSWQQGWTANGSLNPNGGISTASESGTISWQWGDVLKGHSVEWTNALPTYGKIVYVEIRRLNATGSDSALNYITVNYGLDDNGATAIENVGTALSRLDQGNYSIIVTAPADTNWKELKATTNFSVTTADNDWTVDPHFGTVSGFKWAYGTSVKPEATALHGVVQYQYFLSDGTTELSSMPTDVGTYKVRFFVAQPDSKNYASVDETVTVEIGKASDSSFVERLSVRDWIWHGYNRWTNRFVAIPTSGGDVTFTVKRADGTIVSGSINGKTAEFKNVALVLDGGAMVVPQDYFDMLNELTAGTYKLVVHVAETDNYEAFTDDTLTFEVSEAMNTWLTTPSVAAWALNHWKPEENMPVAESRYGYPTIRIISEEDDEVYYLREYVDGQYVTSVNRLTSAEIGWYTMTAEVPAAAGMYRSDREDGTLFGSMRFQIILEGSPDAKNHWIDDPAITGWTANFDGFFNMPIGKPARGLPYFEFYYGVWNEQKGQYEMGDQIGTGDRVTVVSGDEYFTAWYVPVAPGHYFMIAKAIRAGEQEILTSNAIEFTIYERANRFTAEPRIDTVLYLGDKANWAAPTAAALEGTVSFTYVDRETGMDLGAKIPTKPGRYYLVANVTAEFCEKVLPISVPFSIEYSPNSWIKAPSIEGWSTEFDANDPTAQAAFGSEYIEYFYTKADAPTEWTKEKPTEEGDYLLRAEIHLEDYGYQSLVSEEYAFTVAPSFDVTLLIVDIVLASLVAIFTVVVIIFAVRRYREC